MGSLVRAVIDGKVLTSFALHQGKDIRLLPFQAPMRVLVPSPIFLRIDKMGEMSGVIRRGVVTFATIRRNSLSE